MKKRILAAALCAAAVLSLTGCGKEETSAPANTNNSTVNTGTSTPTSTSTTSKTESSAPQSASSAPEESSAPEGPDYSEIFTWGDYKDPDTGDVIGVTITSYLGSDEKIVFPEKIDGKPVLQIGAYSSFENNIDITSVTIPAGVKYIAGRSFKDCLNLEEVIFSGDIPEFVYDTFYNTPWYDRIKAESTDGFVIMGNRLIESAQEPSEVTGDIVIPDGVTKICYAAFGTCKNITGVTIPDSVTEIDGSAFNSCTSMESINLPAGLKKINAYTFYECYSLKSVDIPEGVTEINEGAFDRCSADIHFPDSLTSLNRNWASGYSGTVTFKGNTYKCSYVYGYDENNEALEEAVKQNAVEVEFGDKDIIVVDNVLIKVRPGLTAVEIPDSVTGIADDAIGQDYIDRYYYEDQDLIITYKGKKYNIENLDKLIAAINGN